MRISITDQLAQLRDDAEPLGEPDDLLKAIVQMVPCIRSFQKLFDLR